MRIHSGGIGQIDHRHLDKGPPEISMLVVKIGGPAYRIGMGGGAASSVPSGGNRADLDFNAVQVIGSEPTLNFRLRCPVAGGLVTACGNMAEAAIWALNNSGICCQLMLVTLWPYY